MLCLSSGLCSVGRRETTAKRDDRFRRILPVPVGAGERPFTEPTAAARPWRREPLTLRANAPGSPSSEGNSWCTTPSRAPRAVLVEEPELAVGPLALASRDDRIGRIAAGDHVEDRHGGGSRDVITRLCSA